MRFKKNVIKENSLVKCFSRVIQDKPDCYPVLFRCCS